MIVAAVAAALASSYAGAAVPTLAQAASPGASLVIAGSSAASSAVGTGIERDVCGGASNTLIAASAGGSKNFLAFSCFTATTVGSIPTGSVVTIYYRTEGGSVVGALPIVSGKQIKRLNLADASCTAAGNSATCSVNGTTSIDGLSDSWTGAVVEDTVQLGVTDVEPGQLTNNDYPSNYSVAAFGSATPAQLAGLTTARLFDQVFGLAVNVSGEPFTKSNLNLSKESAANILTGNYTDWSSVPDALNSGNPIASSAAPITHVDREPGSGTRTATNIYFLEYQCGSTSSIPNPTGEVLNFSTTDELTAANGKPGAIAYTSIDQILNPSNGTKWTNLALVTINGVTPSALNAATGAYDFWFEATLVPNKAVTGNSAAISTFLQGDLPKLSTAPASPDILVIPNLAGNTATVPLTNNGSSGTAEIFINPFTRTGHSCSVPSETN
jgi:hypothetical protein